MSLRGARGAGAWAWLAAGLALACGPSGETAPAAAPGAPAQPPPAAAPAGQAPAAPAGDAAKRSADQVWATRCTTCHGSQGRGNGIGAEGLVPPPRDFHDPGWQRSVTGDHLAKIIVEGGAGVGKSPLMPPNPDLASQPEVVGALVERIRGFGAN